MQLEIKKNNIFFWKLVSLLLCSLITFSSLLPNIVHAEVIDENGSNSVEVTFSSEPILKNADIRIYDEQNCLISSSRMDNEGICTFDSINCEKLEYFTINEGRNHFQFKINKDQYGEATTLGNTYLNAPIDNSGHECATIKTTIKQNIGEDINNNSDCAANNSDLIGCKNNDVEAKTIETEDEFEKEGEEETSGTNNFEALLELLESLKNQESADDNECEHDFDDGSWESISNEEHQKDSYCSECQFEKIEIEEHIDNDEDGICDDCKFNLENYTDEPTLTPITLTVKNAVDKSLPVKGAKVTVKNTEGNQVGETMTSNAKGEVKAEFPTGTYKVVSSASGFTRPEHETEFSISKDGEIMGDTDIHLNPASNIVFQVVDKESGSVVQDVTVEIHDKKGNSIATCKTNNEGIASIPLDEMDLGEYTADVQSAGENSKSIVFEIVNESGMKVARGDTEKDERFMLETTGLLKDELKGDSSDENGLSSSVTLDAEAGTNIPTSYDSNDTGNVNDNGYMVAQTAQSSG